MRLNFSKILYNLFFAILLILVLIVIFSLFPFIGNYRILIVQSGSMEPAMHTGSIILIKPAKVYQVGDIITFGKISKTQTPTTHRIFAIKENNGIRVFVTKGDANNAPDMQEIKQEEIIGKKIFSVPYIGYLVAFTRTKIGFVAIILLPLAIIIFDEIRKNVWAKNFLPKQK